MWNVENIENLTNKVIIVTGGNSGLGYEDVKVYYAHGGTVIMACRSIERGQEAIEKITEETMETETLGSIHIMELDLASLQSIASFVSEFKKRFDRLDVLMNNAGVMTTPYGLTEDGFEQQFGINHLGHFALTGQLFDYLKSTPGARVVNISSNSHKTGNMSFKNLMYDGGLGYTPMKAYSRSKLANLLFTYELQRKINQTVYDIRVLAAHPGGAKTNIVRHVEDKAVYKAFRGISKKVVQSSYDGALPGIRASLDPKAFGGEYYGPSGIGEVRGKPVLVSSNELSHNRIVGKRLWKESEKLTGITFDFS